MSDTNDGTGGWSPVAAPAAARLDEALAIQQMQWRRGDRPPAEELLAADSELAQDVDAVLQMICNEVALRESLGEAPSLPEYQARFPQLGDQLRVQWNVYRALFSVAPKAAAPRAAGRAGEKIGRYEVQAILGKGGMGIAYRAWDPDLKRVVAVKTLRAAAADEAEIARFRTESEAIARVRHPNIVQIFDVGDSDGQPFFAMEYCAGGSLADRLKAAPLPPREAARVVEQIARGVDAAHRLHIVHRDLKPANILLVGDAESGIRNSESKTKDQKGERTSPDGMNSELRSSHSELFPKVTDFGLAKALDAEDGQTRSNAVMGTPSYMSPEQAFGDTAKVTAAADIYSLGAVLYECLTGRPPFRGATVAETLDQVRHREPLAVRQLQPKTPVDLETIAHKCLLKDPAKRYATAEAMADDLARALDGRPILARPVGPAERSWRWCRRNPVVAGLIAAVVTVFLAGGTGTTVMWLRASVQRDKAQHNFEDAEANLRETFAAVNDSFVKISEDQLLAEPRMLGLRVKLLSASKPYFEGFVAKRRDDPQWRRELALALFRLAFVGQLVDPPQAAAVKWREAAAAYDRLLQDGEPADEDRYRLALCYESLAYQEMRSDEPGTEEHLRAAITLLRAGTPPPGTEYHAVASEANCLSHLSALAAQKGDAAGSDRLYAEAVALQRAAVTRFPDSAAPADLGQRYFRRGQALLEAGRAAEAVTELERAESVFEKWLSVPTISKTLYGRNLASTLNVLGAARLALPGADPENAAKAEGLWRRALAIWEDLYAQQPATVSFQHGLTRTQRDLAGLLLDAGRLDEAALRANAAADGAAAMLRQNPGNPTMAADAFESFRLAVAVGAGRLAAPAGPFSHVGRLTAQLALLGRFVDLFAPLVKSDPDVPREVAGMVIDETINRAKILHRLNRPAESAAEWARARDLVSPAERPKLDKIRDEFLAPGKKP